MKLRFIVILLFVGCKLGDKIATNTSSGDMSIDKGVSVHQKVPLSASSDTIEGFDAFFDRFERDSVFQLSRASFPLKVVISDDNEEIKVLNRREWKFADFINIKGLIVSKTLITRNRKLVLFQIEDTGVNVTYFFDRKDGLWWLTSIVDESD